LDAQSVKNTDSAEHKGYDGAKKVSGIKRSIAVDVNGLPIAIHITTADVSERDSGIALFTLNAQEFEMVRRIMVDGGYTGDNFSRMVQTTIGADVIIAKQSDLKHSIVTPQRWLVERSFSWLGKWRRLWRNCERKLASSRVMVAVAFLGIILRRF
jgi:transposase